jgi:hypothetical protein
LLNLRFCTSPAPKRPLNRVRCGAKRCLTTRNTPRILEYSANAPYPSGATTTLFLYALGGVSVVVVMRVPDCLNCHETSQTVQALSLPPHREIFNAPRVLDPRSFVVAHRATNATRFTSPCHIAPPTFKAPKMPDFTCHYMSCSLSLPVFPFGFSRGMTVRAHRSARPGSTRPPIQALPTNPRAHSKSEPTGEIDCPFT